MQIDLANWFEIVATLIAILCWCINPLRSLTALSVMLFFTTAIEFTSKYLRIQYLDSHAKQYIYLQRGLYSIGCNLITFASNLAIMYFLFSKAIDKKSYWYLLLVGCIFTVINYTLGQGHKVYNNYSVAFCWLLLIGATLYKLKIYDSNQFSKKINLIILIYLFTILAYYTINLPQFIFFQQVMKEDVKEGIKIYRIINDTANYFLYALLSVVAILLATTKNITSDNEAKIVKD